MLDYEVFITRIISHMRNMEVVFKPGELRAFEVGVYLAAAEAYGVDAAQVRQDVEDSDWM